MVSIRKRKLKGRTYYYLGYSYREQGMVKKKELFLGNRIPTNIEKIEEVFWNEIYSERWYDQLDRIAKNYRKEQKKLPRTAKRKELDSFSVKFTYDTQRIEGSTLTLRETANLLEKEITPPARPLADVKEAEAHSKVFLDTIRYQKDLAYQIMLKWHRDLFKATKADIAGRIRQHQVAISGSKFMPAFPAEIEPLLREFFKWYHRNKEKMHPVTLSGLAHLKFVTIHPFTDGNGRMARLIQNFVLYRNRYPMMSIAYSKRSSYYNALERAQVNDDAHIFLQWFIRKYLEEQKRYLD